jgi:hypothetical protein
MSRTAIQDQHGRTSVAPATSPQEAAMYRSTGLNATRGASANGPAAAGPEAGHGAACDTAWRNGNADAIRDASGLPAGVGFHY